MILLITSFIGGVLTVLAPCTLPLLPIIVGGSLDGKVNIKKALTVVLSLGVSVILFTFILKVSTLFINIPQSVWTIISGTIILVLGLVTLFPNLWEGQWVAKLNIGSNKILGMGDRKKSFWGDIIVGASLGPVFSTCSPTYFIVLATVLPVSPILGILYLLSYATGLCISLFIVAFLGQTILTKLGIAADARGIFKKILGVLFILVGIAIIIGFDKTIETRITNSNYFDVTKVEQKLLNKNDMPGVKTPTANQEDLTILQKSLKYKKVPELSSIDGYINTDGKPITLAELKGKVVLLDIWTYSCINCQRTLPYVNAWYEKYKDDGFVVIGIHTPEFGFEKVQANVEEAVAKLGIKYPVVLDNNYATWRALGNQYWPRKYLIDADGFIVYNHIGEGNYDETEQAIQRTLAERAAKLGTTIKIPESSTPSNTIPVDMNQVSSPETYFGSSRNEYLANGKQGTQGPQTLSLPKTVSSNKLYLDGTWNFDDEYAENSGPAQIVFGYHAKNIYMAAGSTDGVDVSIYRDNVFVKTITIKDEQLYPLIEGTDYGDHTITIKVPKSGLKAFTFTFG